MRNQAEQGMPWTSPSLLQQREEFVRRARLATGPFRELCREFEISPKTGYKWLQRYAAKGRAGLVDASRRPAQARGPQAERWAQRVVQLRRQRPTWGAKKLRVLLAEKYGRRGLPSVRSLERWLKPKGLLRPYRRTKRRPAVPHLQELGREQAVELRQCLLRLLELRLRVAVTELRSRRAYTPVVLRG